MPRRHRPRRRPSASPGENPRDHAAPRPRRHVRPRPRSRLARGIDTSLERDVQTLTLLPGGRFFEVHCYDPHYAARAAGEWEIDGETVALQGVLEILTSDALPFNPRDSFTL